MKKLLLAAGLAAAAVLAPAGAAHADASCVGTDRTIVLCVDPTGRVLVSDCVYLGGSSCTPVTVPGPTVTCGGDIGCNPDVICIKCVVETPDCLLCPPATH